MKTAATTNEATESLSTAMTDLSKMSPADRALFTMAESVIFRQESCRTRVMDELRRVMDSARNALERMERSPELYSGSFSALTPELREMAGQADALRETANSLKFLAKKMDETSGGTDASTALELAFLHYGKRG